MGTTKRGKQKSHILLTIQQQQRLECNFTNFVNQHCYAMTVFLAPIHPSFSVRHLPLPYYKHILIIFLGSEHPSHFQQAFLLSTVVPHTMLTKGKKISNWEIDDARECSHTPADFHCYEKSQGKKSSWHDSFGEQQ